MTTLKGGVTKTSYKNILKNAFLDTIGTSPLLMFASNKMSGIPLEYRAAIKSMFYPNSGLTEKDLTNKEKMLLKEIVNTAKNRQINDDLFVKELQASPDDSVYDYETGWDVPKEEVIKQIQSTPRNSIQYNDYLPFVGSDLWDSRVEPNTYASLGRTLGRAYYNDNNMGTLVKDIYDFPKGISKEEKAGWSPSFKFKHAIGEMFTRPMDVNIQLDRGY